MRRHRFAERGAARKGYVLLAVLWLIVLLTSVAFEVSRRARLERLATLNIVDDVVLTAALDASVEHARSWLHALLAAERVGGGSTVAKESHLDPWGDVGSVMSDTVRLVNARFVSTISDVSAKLNINQAGNRDIAQFFSALGVDARLAEQFATMICARRDEHAADSASMAPRDDRVRKQRPPWSTLRTFKSVDDVADWLELSPQLWQRAAPLLTVVGSGRVNVRTASVPVLMSLPGFSAEVVDAVGEIRDAGGRLNSLDDVLARLSFSAREALLAARPILDQRLSYETVEVEIRSRAWTAGGLYGESVALVHRNDRQLVAYAVRVQ